MSLSIRERSSAFQRILQYSRAIFCRAVTEMLRDSSWSRDRGGAWRRRRGPGLALCRCHRDERPYRRDRPHRRARRSCRARARPCRLARRTRAGRPGTTSPSSYSCPTFRSSARSRKPVRYAKELNRRMTVVLRPQAFIPSRSFGRLCRRNLARAATKGAPGVHNHDEAAGMDSGLGEKLIGRMPIPGGGCCGAAPTGATLTALGRQQQVGQSSFRAESGRRCFATMW